jgi:hypothetical protein
VARRIATIARSEAVIFDLHGTGATWDVYLDGVRFEGGARACPDGGWIEIFVHEGGCVVPRRIRGRVELVPTNGGRVCRSEECAA